MISSSRFFHLPATKTLNERARKSIAQKQATGADESSVLEESAEVDEPAKPVATLCESTNNDVEQISAFREALRPSTPKWGRKGCSRIVLAHLALLAFVCTSSACAPQQIAVHEAEHHGLRVTGTGEATAAPDIATVRVGVEERAATAREAMESVNARMKDVTEAVKKQGVLARHLQTTDLSVHFERFPERPPQPRPEPAEEGTEQKMTRVDRESAMKPAGEYVVRNTMIISLRDLDKVGDVIGAAMSAGANQLYGFELSIDNPEVLENEARDKAVEQAIEKARALAARAGVSLGRIVSILDLQGTGPVPMAKNRHMMMEQSQANVPTERGQLTVSQAVEVTFELERGQQDRD